MKYDYAIIGGGVSGASTALLLARYGCSVVLLEKGERIAGLVRGFQRRGLHFDTGFHYAGGLGEGECFDVLCRFLGLAGRLEKEALDPDGFDTVRCRRPGFEFRFAYGTDRLEERLGEAFPAERRGIAAYLRELEAACAGFPLLNLDADLDRLATPVESGETLQEVLDRLTGNRLLQAVLSVHTLLHGLPPQRAPFALHALIAGPYYRSAHTLKGGGRNLAEAFDVELARRGVDVQVGAEAVAIDLAADGRPKAVRLAAGGEVACGGCVFTAHPALLPALLPEGTFRPAYRKRLRTLAETPSAGLLFGGADQLPQPLAGGNLFLLEEPDSAGRLDGEKMETGPLYVTAARPTGQHRQGEGFLAIAPFSSRLAEEWPARPGSRPPDYPAIKATMMRKMREKLADFYPEFTAQTRWSEGATPLTLRDYGNTPTGSMYGVSHAAGQIGLHAGTRVPGLLLAGQATAAPGVMGAVTSAFLAAGHIVGHERLLKDLRACR